MYHVHETVARGYGVSREGGYCAPAVPVHSKEDRHGRTLIFY